MANNYYEILGIARTASDGEIRRAYKRMALKYHPDKNDHPQAAEYFKEIVTAFETLSDLEKRRRYDNDENSRNKTELATCSQSSTNSLGLIICSLGALFAFTAFKTVQHYTKKSE